MQSAHYILHRGRAHQPSVLFFFSLRIFIEYYNIIMFFTYFLSHDHIIVIIIYYIGIVDLPQNSAAHRPSCIAEYCNDNNSIDSFNDDYRYTRIIVAVRHDHIYRCQSVHPKRGEYFKINTHSTSIISSTEILCVCQKKINKIKLII